MKSICVFGVFVADLCFIGEKIPEVGQTILGTKHLIGPGGKGSNQAIAAARLGGNISFITKVGDDNNAVFLNFLNSSLPSQLLKLLGHKKQSLFQDI